MRPSSLYLIISTMLVIIVAIYLLRSTILFQANSIRGAIWKQKVALSNEEKQSLEEQLNATKFEIVKLR